MARARTNGSTSAASRCSASSAAMARPSPSSARRCTSWTASSARPGGDPHPGQRPRTGAARPLSVREPPRLGKPGARRRRRRSSPTRSIPLRQYVVSGVRSQTETAKRYRYTGMERDEESGLDYHSARYYTPWLGRWLNADPSGLKDGTNLFSYAREDPVGHSDTNGLEPDAYTEKARTEMKQFLEFSDTDRNKHITALEFYVAMQSSTMTPQTFRNTASTLPSSLSLNYTFDSSIDPYPFRSIVERVPDDVYERGENALQLNTEGGSYTNKGSREAAKQRLNRYRDPVKED